jgi:hypothetical protein
VSLVRPNFLTSTPTNPGRTKSLRFLYFTVRATNYFSHLRAENLSASRYKHTRWLQAFLFVLSVASGTRMIYQVNYSNWLANMQQVSGSCQHLDYRLSQFVIVPAFGDHLGLHCASTGSRPCGDCSVGRGVLGVVVWSATSFQLAAHHARTHVPVSNDSGHIAYLSMHNILLYHINLFRLLQFHEKMWAWDAKTFPKSTPMLNSSLWWQAVDQRSGVRASKMYLGSVPFSSLSAVTLPPTSNIFF